MLLFLKVFILVGFNLNPIFFNESNSVGENHISTLEAPTSPIQSGELNNDYSASNYCFPFAFYPIKNRSAFFLQALSTSYFSLDSKNYNKNSRYLFLKNRVLII